MTTNIEKLLLSHGIKPSTNRLLVLKALDNSERPVSQGELEQRLLSVDKSGISRALAIFRKYHLVHVIADGSDSLRYELCHSHHKQEDDDQHVHFFCEHCRRTFCLDNVQVPKVEVPQDFTALSASYVVSGVCPECRLTPFNSHLRAD